MKGLAEYVTQGTEAKINQNQRNLQLHFVGVPYCLMSAMGTWLNCAGVTFNLIYLKFSFFVGRQCTPKHHLMEKTLHNTCVVYTTQF